MTVSIGIATVPDLPVSASRELVRAADRALYAAKQAGRNRVVVCQPDMVEGLGTASRTIPLGRFHPGDLD